MLTLLKNIERFNKRYNKKRGSAMLMVLMTMAIIIVVGTSMLFVTLSSFSNSIADTQQERAYNAALVMTETLKSSSYLGKLIESNSFELEQDNPVKLQFDNGDLDDELDDFTIINGVKVYVTFTNASKEKTSLDSVLVDVRGVKGSQESTVSFTYNKETTVKNVTLKDTFGNALVTNNDLGGEQKDKNLVFKRIEGDISINCWDEEVVNGKTVKKMTTRYFNPIILEGLTGSIFANGDLIIGAADNVIKVQGNIYCDGNLTIRGLDLGVNLPALFKNTYHKKYIKYSTIGNETIAGFDILGTGEYIERKLSGKVNEAMYLKYTTDKGDDDFLPLQVYDEVSHYTLMDLAPENAETYTFWTRNWEKGGEVEEVTITLRIKDDNGDLVPIDAEFNRKVNGKQINNAQYLGATMYSTSKCKPEDMIMQYPKGGNVYCSGDIIFDRVNSGYNWVFSAALFGGSSEYKYHDLAIYDSTGKGKIDASNKKHCDKVKNATVSYNKTKMRGDIFCMGRMIIAPENLAIKVSKDETKDETMVFTRMNGSNFNRYFDNETFNSDNFFSRLKTLLGFDGDTWNKNAGNFNYDATDSYRFVYERKNKSTYNAVHSFTDHSNVESFLTALKNHGQENLENALEALVEAFNKTINDSGYILKKDNGYLPGEGSDRGEHYKLRPIEFSETSNLYIYNWDYASLIENTEKKEGSEEQVKVQRQLNSTSLVQESRVDIDNTLVSTVNDTTYKAALTVKYQPLKVNEIYVGSGNIEAVGIDAFGYKSKAEVQAKKIDIIGDMISNEYQEHSLLDLIMKIYGLNKEQALEKLRKEYLKIDDNDNIYTGYADLTYSIKDDEKGNDCVFLKYDLIALAYYKCTYYRKDTDRIIEWTKENGEVEYLLLPSVLYRDGKFYIVDQKTGDWDPYNPENPDELDKFMEITKLSYEVIQRARKNKFKFSDGLYGIDDTRLKEIATTYIDNHKVIEKTRYEKSQYKGRGTFGFNSVKEGETRKLALYVGTYSFADNLETTGIIETNKNKAEYNNPPIVLTYDDIKEAVENYANVKQLALLSNSANNSFKAITGKKVDVENMIFAENPITSVGTAAFLSVRAFSDEDHGMYLRSSNARYANADKNSSVSAVFREIIDEGFAKIAILKTTKLTTDIMRKQIENREIIVDEYNQFSDVQKESLNPLSELKQNWCHLQELQEGSTTYTIAQLDEWKKEGNPRGTTNFYTADSLASIRGKTSSGHFNNVWTYVRHSIVGSEKTFYAIYNSDSVDKNVRVMRFTNTMDSKVTWTCKETFGLDPLYCSYDNEGNPVDGNQGGVFVNLLPTMRTQVDYEISPKKSDNPKDKNKPRGVYFNFSGETGGYNTKEQDPVIFGASIEKKQNGKISFIDQINLINNSKRMNITINTEESDVYVYINAPSKYIIPKNGEKGSYVKNGDEYTLVGEGKGDYELEAGIEFRKCSWRVKGKHNAYIMLVGDTSINANAYKLSVNIGGGVNSDTADRSDSMLGTHFYSGFYTTYAGSYTMTGENESSLKLAAKEKETVESGNLCIIGTMGNQLLLGRGGYINGFVYLPNGKYVNNSTGFLGILPNAYSNNNQATIVAKDISVKGSNIGNLVFQAFDVSSSAGGAGSDIDIDYIESNEKITYTKWNFGGYYYG
ncbi:MAG: hypothetical protein MR725_06615 [Clostridiales bacterium]|nr:hypothetical protein [Clostridiales bacterium]MDD7231236.1 hypothetical protein [Clostridiales bacterium]MDY2721294.1 hypothetical protein [Eubacteriales bacterium]